MVSRQGRDAGADDVIKVEAQPVPPPTTRGVMAELDLVELVIPETNRTDLLLFKFGLRAELSAVLGSEVRARATVSELSASMGHWDAARDVQLDSILLREFGTSLDYYRCYGAAELSEAGRASDSRFARPGGAPAAGKSTLGIEVGSTALVASADQVISISGMVSGLLEELLAQEEDHDPMATQVFAAEDPFDGEETGERYGFDELDGSVISATTGRSSKHGGARSAHRSALSSKYSEYSDSDWQTVASESDHGSYAVRSRHSGGAPSSANRSAGSSDGEGEAESESGVSQSFHSAENDPQTPGRGEAAREAREREELFSERLSQYSWEQGSYNRDSSRTSSSYARGRGDTAAAGKGGASASIFGVAVQLPANTTIRISCANVSLQLTSDPFGQVTPLWQMQVGEVSFAAKSTDAVRLLLTAQLTVQLKYFNLSVLCWESALEPLLLRVDANRDLDGWSLDLNSEHNMNLNCSEALLQALEPLIDTTRSAPNSSVSRTSILEIRAAFPPQTGMFVPTGGGGRAVPAQELHGRADPVHHRHRRVRRRDTNAAARRRRRRLQDQSG